jgi:hypothetical protein
VLVEESERAGGPSGPGEVVQPGRLIREATPRLVRDAFGPLATFFVGWKLFGLTVGIFLAVAFGTLVFLHERRQGRPAALVRVAMAIVCIRAIVGLSSGSATVYLAQEIGIDILLATVVLSGLLSGRPIAAWVASDVYPFTPEMRDSATFSEVMRTVTLVWGFYFLSRAAVRLGALLSLSTDSYVLVIALTDVPFLVALLAWSIHYTTGAFRRSEQWGVLFAGVPGPPGSTPP